MLVLIDESGCSGFKFGRGSTTHFVVGMAIFRDFREAEKTSTTISAAKIDLRQRAEFKFSKCCDRVRDGFFQAVAPHGFGVRALVVDKEKIYSPHLRGNPDEFYNYFVQMLMKNDGGVLTGARVKIDGAVDRELAVYLRRQLGASKISKLTFNDSKRDNLIQLADMVTGAIARSYTKKANADRWRNMIAEKIEDVWKFK